MRRAAALVSHHLDASTCSSRIAERFLIDLSWASSHLEGNTYEYLQAEALINFAEQAEGHDWTEVTMILNHKRAIGLLLDAIDSREVAPQWLSRLHSLLMRDLLEPGRLGRFRDSSQHPCRRFELQAVQQRDRAGIRSKCLVLVGAGNREPVRSVFRADGGNGLSASVR